MKSVTLNDSINYAKAEIAKMDIEGIKEAGIFLDPFNYYVLGTCYPPLKAMYEVTEDEVYAGVSDTFNLYVHIPFCEQYCTFCHFAKEINPKQERVYSYLTALYAEIEAVYKKLGKKPKIKTIYFGGGTASYLKPKQLDEVFTKLNEFMEINSDTEITFELHPGVIRQEDYEDRLKIMKSAGVNRWVFGVQSMDDKVLKKLNRGHSEQEVYGLLELLNKNGCYNVSLDLIFGLPYQTFESWYQTLIKLVNVGVPKFNIFPLMFKASDPITKHYIKEPEIFPNGDGRMIMHFMVDYLLLETFGYKYGPVFYYSKMEGPHSRQQKSKFEDIEHTNLLGIGVSSFGFVGNTHYYNICDMNQYIETASNKKLPVWMGYTLPKEELLRREVMMTLRSEGVSISKVKQLHEVDLFIKFKEQFEKLIKLNMVFKDGDLIKLTRYGALHMETIGLLFVSDEVNKICSDRNIHIEKNDPLKNPVERFDYSPIKRANELHTASIKKRYSELELAK